MNQERRKIELATEAVSSGSYGMLGIFIGIAIIIFVIGNFLTLLFYYRGFGASASFAGIASILAGFGGCVLGYFYFRNYYRRKYGFVTTKSADKKDALKWFLLGLAFSLTSKVIGNIDVALSPLFSVTVLAFAVVAFVVWQLKYRGVSNAFLYFSIILLAASFLPWNEIISALEPTRVIRHRKDFFGDIFLLLFGIAGVVSGLTDLTILSKTLMPVAGEEEVYESV